MPRALLVYGSNSSNAYTAAGLVANELKSAGFDITVLSAAEAKLPDVAAADFVILGSCTWSKPTSDGHELQGQPQELFESFADKLRPEKYPGKKFAVFATGDSRYTMFCGAADYIEKLVRDIGGTQVGESLRIDGLTASQEDVVRVWARAIGTAYLNSHSS